MASSSPRRRELATAVVVGLLAGAAVRGQTTTDEPRFVPVVERWLASDQTSRDELDAVVKALLADPKTGIAWLAARLPAAAAAPAEPRAKGLRGLVGHVALEFVRRQRATGITFQGQYAALLPLQPDVGAFLFGLLLDTPEWFPSTHRLHLVPVLRDLQPKLPDAARVDAVLTIVENERIEPEDLRRALAAMLWQWGKKAPAQQMIAALVAASGEGDAEDRVRTTLDLADYWCLLREYKQAANAHRTAQTLAQNAGVALRPVAWYAAACVHAMLGDNERGMSAMERCVDLLASPHLDNSLRLARSMFDNDPELAPLRALPRWAELMQRAFPAAPAGR